MQSKVSGSGHALIRHFPFKSRGPDIISTANSVRDRHCVNMCLSAGNPHMCVSVIEGTSQRYAGKKENATTKRIYTQKNTE